MRKPVLSEKRKNRHCHPERSEGPELDFSEYLLENQYVIGDSDPSLRSGRQLRFFLFQEITDCN